MLSETLADGLGRYGIGEKVRALRLGKKLGLVELGEHTGLSPALLSKIENGRIFPTLPTLLRIALVFSVGLDHFFAERGPGPVLEVVRRKDRLRFPQKAGEKAAAYHFECLDFPATERKLNAYLAEFRHVAQEKLLAHQHEGVEFIYLISGRLLIKVGAREIDLDQGDSIYFDSSVPHSYRRQGRGPCRAVVVTLPEGA